MQRSGKWKKALATGLISSALFAGVTFGAESRMTTEKSTASKRATTQGPRTVDFKTEQTDSWLCNYVSPFFCSSIPSVASTPQGGAQTTSRRGRR
ncbi:MAG TPA: hypothetical protein VIY96_11695 [Thermoanaerobaculia bacterium]